MQLSLNCTTLHYNYNCTTLTLQLQLHYLTLHYTRLHYTIPNYSTTIHYTKSHHTTTTTATATTLITQHYYNYNSTTLQLRLQLPLHYSTLHPAVVVRWPLQTLQPVQKTQLQPPFGPSVDSLCHPWFATTSLSYTFPIFETSATALCGTTGTNINTDTDTDANTNSSLSYIQSCCHNSDYGLRPRLRWRLRLYDWTRLESTTIPLYRYTITIRLLMYMTTVYDHTTKRLHTRLENTTVRLYNYTQLQLHDYTTARP